MTHDTFVGRGAEMGRLRARLRDLAAGRGGVVMISGEAGIGKTRFTEELAAVAGAEGAEVMSGRCFEGPCSPPYWPWKHVLASCVRSVGAHALTARLGPGAAALGALVPEVGSALPQRNPPRLAPGDERIRLYEAVRHLLLWNAADRSIVLILDDLHWADADSLGLLAYVVGLSPSPRWLLVCTYREPDLRTYENQALTELLGSLRREPTFEWITLQGLAIDDLAAYLSATAGHELPRALVGVIHEETRGNPLYTREVFRHLVEEKSLVERGGRWTTDFSLRELGIPAGVREVVHQRLGRLSADTVRILQLGAALGTAITFEVLLRLSGVPEGRMLDCIDEALRAGSLHVAGAARYEFSHAIVRRAIYDDLNPDRRARLHRRIAEILEGLPGTDPLEIAGQYHASAALPGGERGIAAALAAADRARAASAPVQAAAPLRIARDLAAAAEPRVRADVLCRLARAEAEAMGAAEISRAVTEAVAALERIGRTASEIAGFLNAVARDLKEVGASPGDWEPLIERGLALVGECRDITWARLLLLRDRLEPIGAGGLALARWTGSDPEAVAIARATGDEDDYAATLQPFDVRTPPETAEILRRARTWRRPSNIRRALDLVNRDLQIRYGDYRQARAILRELLELSVELGSIPGQAEALAQTVACLAARRWESSGKRGRSSRDRGRWPRGSGRRTGCTCSTPSAWASPSATSSAGTGPRSPPPRSGSSRALRPRGRPSE
jgi:hypothetical protein